jgi:ABC-2 type transport system ATP-binding protein
MPIIEVTHLRKTYGSTIAVDDVSLSVDEAEIFGIVGPNGAGKTTTVESISGLRTPDRGTVRVFGLDPTGARRAVRSRVGVQLQASQMPDKMRVREALELYASFYAEPLDPVVLATEVGIEGRMEARFSTLSGGEKQRLSIALALIGDPEVVILDELTTGLDPQARRETWALVERIRDRGVTVVLVTHFMEEAERLCDRVALVDGGRVVAVDTPEALAGRARPFAQQIRFRAPEPFDHRRLTALAHVREVTADGDDVIVSGDDGVLLSLATALAQDGITATHLRMDVPTLDDAFLALTGTTIEEGAA